MMNRRHFRTFLLAGVLAIAVALTGCDDKKEERQLALRDSGIEKLTTGDYTGAEQDFSEALHLSTLFVTAREVDLSYYLAASRVLQQDYAGAIETYTNLLTFEEDNADAYFLRGSVNLIIGEKDACFADYRNAVGADSEDYERYIEIYRNLTASGCDDEAAYYLNAALEIEGNEADNYFYRGRIYQYLGQDDVAETAFIKAMDSGGDEAGIYLAQIYLARGEEESARDLISGYTDRKKYSLHERVLTGQLLLQLGDYEQALANYDAAFAEMGEERNNEYTQPLLEGRIAALEFTGDFAGARDAAQEYVAQFPSDGRMVDELAFLNTRV